MTVKELQNILNKLPPSLPVHIMEVEEGITFARDIHSVFKAEPYDGHRVWIIPAEDRLLPQWLPRAA